MRTAVLGVLALAALGALSLPPAADAAPLSSQAIASQQTMEKAGWCEDHLWDWLCVGGKKKKK